MKKLLKLSLYLFLVASLITATYYIGFSFGARNTQRTSDFALVTQVRDLITNNYNGTLPENAVLQRGAARGYIQAVGDPYTVFLDPPARELETQNLQGEFGGIGANLARDADGNTLLTPQPDMPAEKAGIQKEDRLLAVDGKPITKEMSLDQIVALVRGPLNTQVVIVVGRGSQQLSFTITRQRIELPSVDWRLIEKDKRVSYIRINRFSDKTPKEMQRALEEIQKQKADRVIVDLRGNGGGLLNAVLDTLKLFLDGGVMMIEVAKGEPEKIYSTADKGLAAEMKVVVLINKGTASASEIFAGALRDRGRAPLIGQTSYGKGSVQFIFALDDGSSIHVTHALWFTPNKIALNGVGLKPDIEVAPGKDGADPELDRAVEYLSVLK